MTPDVVGGYFILELAAPLVRIILAVDDGRRCLSTSSRTREERRADRKIAVERLQQKHVKIIEYERYLLLHSFILSFQTLNCRSLHSKSVNWVTVIQPIAVVGALFNFEELLR